MRNDRTDEIINNILQLRIDIAKIDLKLEQTFRAIAESGNENQIPKKEKLNESGDNVGR